MLKWQQPLTPKIARRRFPPFGIDEGLVQVSGVPFGRGQDVFHRLNFGAQ